MSNLQFLALYNLILAVFLDRLGSRGMALINGLMSLLCFVSLMMEGK